MKLRNNHIIQSQIYYPFGMLMPERMFSADSYRYGHNTQEKIDEISGSGNHNTALYWEYDTRLGRRWNQDPKPNPSVSNYNCFAGNPIWFSDVLGDSAWTIKNKWNTDFTNKYNDYTSQKAQQLKRSGCEYTCEDFTLTTIIDFAKENQLPFKFTNGEGTFDASSDKYTDVATFKNDVLKTSGASDLQSSYNTTSISLKGAGPGDLILNRNADNNATHAQLITSKNKLGFLGIHQGNSGLANSIPYSSGILGAGNPRSPFYTGTKVQIGIYVPQLNLYKNYSTDKITENFSTERNIEFRRWNYSNFNK